MGQGQQLQLLLLTEDQLLLEVGGGGNFLKVGFFSRWVFGIFLKKVFLQGGFLAFFKKRFFCKVFFFKKLNDVLKGGGFFSIGGGNLVNFIHFF